jgi:hypothetical protein
VKSTSFEFYHYIVFSLSSELEISTYLSHVAGIMWYIFFEFVLIEYCFNCGIYNYTEATEPSTLPTLS